MGDVEQTFKSHHKAIMIMGALILAEIAYLIYKSKSTAPIVINTPGAVPPGTTATTPVTSTTPATTTTPPASTGTSITDLLNSGGSGGAMSQSLVTFANSLSPKNRAQFLSVYDTMPQADVNGLLDIVQNAWLAGKTPTSAQAAFWTAFTKKYHVDDGTFVG